MPGLVLIEIVPPAQETGMLVMWPTDVDVEVPSNVIAGDWKRMMKKAINDGDSIFKLMLPLWQYHEKGVQEGRMYTVGEYSHRRHVRC